MKPIDLILYCPNCGLQHIDAPEIVGYTPTRAGTLTNWDNPPHKSHLCHGCGCIWRPADVATNGVAELKTSGKDDTWPAVHNEEVRAARGGQATDEAERIAELEAEVAHVRRWYGDRLEILSAWAREHLTGEQLHTFFNIAANARPHHTDEPEWFRAVIARLAALGVKASQPARQVDDLAALVGRLVRALRKAAPDNALADQALDYLRRQGLQGSPLRNAGVVGTLPDRFKWDQETDDTFGTMVGPVPDGEWVKWKDVQHLFGVDAEVTGDGWADPIALRLDATRYRALFALDNFCRDPLWPVVDWMRGTRDVSKAEVDAALDATAGVKEVPRGAA
jgi:hypothetical protein